MSRARRWLLFSLKALVSVSLIAYLLNSMNLSEAAAQAKALSVTACVAAILLLCAYLAVAAARWYEVLRALKCNPGLLDATRITFIGAFFNQFLPATVGGDAIRVWEACRGGLGVAPAIHSVILDRAVYLLTLSLLAAAGIGAWDQGRLPPGTVLAFWTVFAAALGLALALTALDRLPMGRLPASFRRSAIRFSSDSRMLFSNPGSLAAVLLTGLANQALLVAVVCILAGGLGLQVAWTDFLALMPAIVLVSSLPISVAGWGVREYAMVTGLSYAGVPAESALVLSLALALFYATASMLGGVLWLVRRKTPAAEPPA